MSWLGLHHGWAWVLIGIIFSHILMQAVYEKYAEIQKERDDLVKRQKEIEDQRTSPLELIFDETRHSNRVEDVLFTRLEVFNTDPIRTVENVTIRVHKIELLKTYPTDRLSRNQQFVNALVGVRLALKLIDSGPMPFSPPPASVDLQAMAKAEFEFVRVHTRIGNHFIYHGDVELGQKPMHGPALWRHKPNHAPPPGAYRVTVIAQGKNVPPVHRTFLFWGTKDRTFFKPIN